MSEENVEQVSRFIEHVNRTSELGPDLDSVFDPKAEFSRMRLARITPADEVRDFLKDSPKQSVALTRDRGDT